MRRPFSSDPDGFLGHGALLDLRQYPAELQDELFFVTAYVDYEESELPELHLIDTRDDHVIVTTLPPPEHGKPILDRYPMRGPYALELVHAGESLRGFIEQPGDPLDALTLRPFSLDGETPADRPIVSEPGGVPQLDIPITRVPAGLYYFTLYATATESLYLKYKPDSTKFEHQLNGTRLATNHLEASGFRCVLDRIPVRGPGTVTADLYGAILYGFLST